MSPLQHHGGETARWLGEFCGIHQQVAAESSPQQSRASPHGMHGHVSGLSSSHHLLGRPGFSCSGSAAEQSVVTAWRACWGPAALCSLLKRSNNSFCSSSVLPVRPHLKFNMCPKPGGSHWFWPASPLTPPHPAGWLFSMETGAAVSWDLVNELIGPGWLRLSSACVCQRVRWERKRKRDRWRERERERALEDGEEDAMDLLSDGVKILVLECHMPVGFSLIKWFTFSKKCTLLYRPTVPVTLTTF